MAGNGDAERTQPGRMPGGGWVPVPDPTELTTQAVASATEVFRRELQNLREIIETRLSGSDRDRELLWTEFHAWPEHLQTILEDRRREFASETASLRTLLEQRIDAMDKAVKVALGEREQYVQALLEGYDTRIAANREYAQAQLDVYVTQARERFDSVRGQFAASKEAVSAAFDAASKAVAEQNRVISLALDKSDATTSDQITALSRVTDAGLAGLADKIDDARNRITTIESLTQGIEQAGGRQREERGLAHSGTQIALFSVAVFISVISAVIGVIALVHH